MRHARPPGVGGGSPSDEVVLQGRRPPEMTKQDRPDKTSSSGLGFPDPPRRARRVVRVDPSGPVRRGRRRSVVFRSAAVLNVSVQSCRPKGPARGWPCRCQCRRPAAIIGLGSRSPSGWHHFLKKVRNLNFMDFYELWQLLSALLF